jgi:type IV pilus assembly protein PilA
MWAFSFGVAFGWLFAALIGYPGWQPAAIRNSKGELVGIDKRFHFTWFMGIIPDGVYWLVRRARERAHKRKGFTLIELIVVMIIIAILAGIAVPIFLNQRIAAWKSTVVVDTTNARMVVESGLVDTDGSLKGVSFTVGTHAAPMLMKGADGVEVARSTVSPGNTVTTALGKTDHGEACYIITGVNEHVKNWDHVVTSDPSCAVPSTGPTQEKVADAFVVLYDKAAATRQGSPGLSEQEYGALGGRTWTQGVPAKGDVFTGVHGYVNAEDGTRYWMNSSDAENITAIDGLSNWSWDSALTGTWDGGVIVFHFKDGHAVKIDPTKADVTGALTLWKEK